ncbi:putative nucleic acid-binding protein [Aminobacter lissarensis]|uniref:Nucleic acid-binding protein n=1 Tax=Aminobacter carboxidus TaxID=376165 RepID=A0A8E1WD77_9HYPH|nr:PIN domain-containing protein [Aminobacter lissarensis]MBB6465484.1 putative nucleic acid-binding protein [Aminobacter lissarensis]
MRFALDTNILAYAEGVNDANRAAMALDLLARLPQDETVIPVQVLGELFTVLVRKANRSPLEAREAILQWRDTFAVANTTPDVMFKAADLAADHRLSIWDAVILCAASSAGCRLLLSEDMQDGFTWGGVTVVNPFAASPHPLLAAMLEN